MGHYTRDEYVERWAAGFDSAEAVRARASARGANAVALAVAGAASRERRARLKHNAEAQRPDATNAEVAASRRDWMAAADALDGALDEFEAGGIPEAQP